MTSRISVLVPTFNRAALLDQCLESLLAQTVAPHQVIVIDDGSTDDTPNRVARFGKAVTYLHKPNGGKASALNFGLSHVSGDFVWVFDDDDVALPTANEVRLRALAARPDAGFVVTNHLCGQSRANSTVEPVRASRWPAVDEKNFLLTLMQGCFVHHNSALVRTHCYREVGPFREELKNAQDYDMQLRLALRYPAVLLDEPTFIFRMHEGERGPQGDRFPHHERERRFARFDQLVGSHLRAASQLGDYLVPRRGAALTPHEEGEALLNRMTVMASKGLLDEFREDARHFVKRWTALGVQRLTDEQRKIAMRAIQMRYLLLRVLANDSGLIAGARDISPMPLGRALLRRFSRGLAGAAWWGEHSGVERLKLLYLAVRLLGFALWPMHRGKSQ